MQVYSLPELRLWPDKSAKLYAIRRFLGGSATSRIRGKLLVAITTIIVLFALIVSLWSRRQEPVGRHNNALGNESKGLELGEISAGPFTHHHFESTARDGLRAEIKKSANPIDSDNESTANLLRTKLPRLQRDR
nr:PREDICTED: uncharacterized protein LOC109035451 [Bemisia tabaci]